MHIAREDAPNTIIQFLFDVTTGQLTPNNPPRVPQPDWTGPRHHCFHPSKDVVCFSNEQGCSVSVYTLDTAKGTLTPFQTISTLPEGWRGQRKCSQIRITPDGLLLYTPNRGHDSIAAFVVYTGDRRLSAIGQFPAEKIPSAFEIDGRLAVYRIDADTGRLDRIATHDVGAVPM